MRVHDLLSGLPSGIRSLGETEDPLRRPHLMVGGQVTRVVVDVIAATVHVLFELRQASRLPANTALLRVDGVVRQDWIRSAWTDDHTSWTITDATAHRRRQEVVFSVRCGEAGALRLVGASAEVVLLDVTGAAAPPSEPIDPRALARLTVADESSACEIVGVARWPRDG
ncbi:hypothetical protein [Microbacterium sp. 179-I 3D3 NHS]|uniref:hypothetical protein n=1 Tax=Microbacterium sp. 179-I 3D3 NHS TaxID=3142382 RepID=UPI00399F2A4A